MKKKVIEIDFWGKAWSNNTAAWIYYDTILDTESLRNQLLLKKHIITRQNLDNKSGLEKGFVDTITGEGIVGKVI